MAGSDSGTGVAGSSFTHYAYPGIYQDQVCEESSAKSNASISPALDPFIELSSLWAGARRYHRELH